MKLLPPEYAKALEVELGFAGRIQLQYKDELYQALERTHFYFNEKVAAVMREFLRVLKDDNNPELARLTRWAILNIQPAGQCASHFVHPFTSLNSKSGANHQAFQRNIEMKKLYYHCKERGDLLYDLDHVWGSFHRRGSKGFISEVHQQAIEKMSRWLRQLQHWHEGDFIPPEQMEREKFIKEYGSLIKEHGATILDDNTGHFKPIHSLLEKKKRGVLIQQLRTLHSDPIAFEQELTLLGEAYQAFSSKAIGKRSWLKQKQEFETRHPQFLQQYQALLQTLNEKMDKHGKRGDNRELVSLPKRWYRFEAFIEVMEKEGTAGLFGMTFRSPLQESESLAAWETLRNEFPELRALSDLSSLVRKWPGTTFYQKQLRKLNPGLFAKDGFFTLLETYRSFEGKPFQEFRKPPALRFPVCHSVSYKNHPDWLTFSRTGHFKYRALKITGPAEVQLIVRLIQPDKKGVIPYCITVKLDHRLKSLQPAELFGIPKGQWEKNLAGQSYFSYQLNEEGETEYEEKNLYPWTDPDGVLKPLEICGWLLVYRNNAFYLNGRFTSKTPPPPKIITDDSSENGYRYKIGTRLLGVDLGQKADAIVTIMELTEEGLKQVPFKPYYTKKRKEGQTSKPVIYQWIHLSGGVGYRAIRHTEDSRQAKLAKLKKVESDWHLEKTGTPTAKNTTRGERFQPRLANYLRNCREQHYKQLAGVLVKIAEQNGCHGIVHENLQDFRVSHHRTRRENRRITNWAVQTFLVFLKQLSTTQGILCFSKYAAYSSQMCSHCGSWGLRYKLPTQKEWQRRCKKSQAFAKLGPQPRPIIEKGGDWFICSQVDCKRQGGQKRFTLNADANAARNLLIRAFRSDWWGVSTLDEVERNAKEQEINDYLQGKVTFLEKQLTFTLASS